MGPAILVIAFGGLLVYSSLKGISITDALAGVAGDSLDPQGASKDSGVSDTGTSGDPRLGDKKAKNYDAGSFKGPNPELLNKLADLGQSRFNLTISSTTGGTHVPGSYHYSGRAFDISGAASDMMAFFNYAHDNYGSNLTELFYDPAGNRNIDNGKERGPIGGHDDHVHVAV